MAISAELADHYIGNVHGIYYFEAIDISHPLIPSDLHYTNASFQLEGLLDNTGSATAIYLPLPFTANIPEKNTEGNQSLDLSFSNVSAELVPFVDAMIGGPQQAMSLTYRVFLSSQTNGSGHYLNQLVPAWKFEVSSATFVEDVVTMSATKLDIHNRVFPRVRYTRLAFPGLDR